jgi:uncharacterized damage-inducible protein DinB
MVYGGKELAGAFRTVRKNTIQVAEDIPETQYNFVPAPGCQTVAQMFAHIAVATTIWEELHRKLRISSLAGFDFLGTRARIEADEATLKTKAQILDRLRTGGEAFAAWLETVTPEFLAEVVTEPDGVTPKSRFERMLAAKEHEMHHRAQLMLVERQLGIVPHVTRQFNERLAQLKAAKAQAGA